MSFGPVDNTSSHLIVGRGGTFIVRGEEIIILLAVLFLWLFAVTSFIHRWGKIRMLEPGEPSYHKRDSSTPAKVKQKASRKLYKLSFIFHL